MTIDLCGILPIPFHNLQGPAGGPIEACPSDEPAKTFAFC